MNRRSIWTWGLALALGSSVWMLSVSAFAQTENQDTATNQEATVAEPPKATAEQSEFEKLSTTWAELEAELKLLQAQFNASTAIDRPSIAVKFREKLDQANEVLAKLKSTAMAMFESDPANEQAARTLTGFLVNDASSGNDFACFQLADALMAKGIDAKYFEAARDAARLGPRGREIIEEIIVRYEESKSDAILPQVKMVVAGADGKEKGTIVLELFEDQAPNTVANYIHLIEQGFYTEKGKTFHRVMEDFMAQGGCPNGDGSSGPGWEILNEVNRPDYRRHFTGSLSMALNPGEPDSGGSQFFITLDRTSHLDGVHCVFGRVLEGQDVVESITKRIPADDNAAEPDYIKSIEVIQKRDHEYVPEKIEEATGEDPEK